MWSRDGKKYRPQLPLSENSMSGSSLTMESQWHWSHYGDIEPDFKTGLPYGIRSQYLRPGQKPAPNEWGAIAAWAWGLSRAMRVSI